MVESMQYTTQDFSKRSSLLGSSSRDLYGASWKSSSYSNLEAQPVNPIVLQPSVLGQTSTIAPTTTSTMTSSSLLPTTGSTGLATTGQQPFLTQTLNAPPVSQVEHVYEKKVINQPYVHQVVHHPINEIHQQHMRNDVYAQPVTQVVPEQRFLGPTTGIYSSGAGFTAGTTAPMAAPGAGVAYQKPGFLDRLKAKRAQRKLAKQQMYGTAPYTTAPGSTIAPAPAPAPILGPSQYGTINQPLYAQQQFPAATYQSGLPIQSSSYYGSTSQTTGSWISGQPRI